MNTDLPIMEDHDEIARLADELRKANLAIAFREDTIAQIRESNDALGRLAIEQGEALKAKEAECERLRAPCVEWSKAGFIGHGSHHGEYEAVKMANATWRRIDSLVADALAPVNGGKV